MLPQNPPQPTCSYFPLKLLSVGIQTSKLMIESLVGVAVPSTRQNAGSPVFVMQPGLPVVQPGGVLNVPPVTDWAAVITASGNDRFTRPSQLLVAETGVVPSTMAASETVESATDLKRRLMAILPSRHRSLSLLCAPATPLSAGKTIAAASTPVRSQPFMFVLPFSKFFEFAIGLVARSGRYEIRSKAQQT